MRILLVAGGWSTEREVSLQGARGIQAALEEMGHTVVFFDPAVSFTDFFSIVASVDFAFVNLHGVLGEDGTLPALLDYVGCPYQCTGVHSSLFAVNKVIAKMIYTKVGLPTAPFLFFTEPQTTLPNHVRYPVFVKSTTGGSSLHLYKADTEQEALEAVRAICSCNEHAILEEAITGIEVTCGVLDDTPLPPVLIKAKEGVFFDYASKYNKNGAEEICPAPLPEHVYSMVQDYALRAHVALGIQGYSRTDMIISEDSPILLETNTIPGMTATSLFPLEAKAAGMEFSTLLNTLIEKGIARHNAKVAHHAV